MPARIMGRRGRSSDANDADISAQSPLGEAFEPLMVRIPIAVQVTGIGRSKLYELIAAGEVDIVKVGSRTLIPVDSLKAFVQRSARNALR